MRLEDLITSERHQRLQQAAAQRTRFHIFVLEEVHKGHNVSAILRSLDGFGFQDVYVINGRTALVHKPEVAKGAHKWIDIHRFDDWQSCIREVKQRGYRVAVTGGAGRSITEVDWTIPTAIVMGAELDGIDPQLQQAADLHITIPMVGLTQSFNVSVAAACIAFHIKQSTQEGVERQKWFLSVQEQQQLIRHWIESDRLSY